jgi:hypothetical protein
LRTVSRSRSVSSGRGDGAVARDHHDLRTGVQIPKARQRLQPIQPRHLHVEKDQVRPELGIEADRLATRRRHPDFEVLVLQDLLQRLANALLVVHNEHAMAHERVAP